MTFLSTHQQDSKYTFTTNEVKAYFLNDHYEAKKLLKTAKTALEKCKKTNDIIGELNLTFGDSGHIPRIEKLIERDQNYIEKFNAMKEKTITLVSKDELVEAIQKNKLLLESINKGIEEFHNTEDFHKLYKDIPQETKEQVKLKYNIDLTEVLDYYSEEILASCFIGEFIGSCRHKCSHKLSSLESDLAIVEGIAKFNNRTI